MKYEPRKLKISYTPYHLIFKEPAGTSRGILREKLTYLIKVSSVDNPERCGYGEAAIFPGLSKETPKELSQRLEQIVSSGEYFFSPGRYEMSCLQFGLETAVANLSHGDQLVFPSHFTRQESEIIINGLIWMGDFEMMKTRISQKLDSGFSCIKVKIGSIDWEKELALIKYLRHSGGDDIIIRVDANGAFTPDNVLYKLEELAEFNVHSIEQPIAAGQWNEMKKLCRVSPIPVALDEELIGIPPGNERNRLLEEISPSFLILKPALCGGFTGSTDWIERARKYDIGWWITSALESSIGLNAISQFTATLSPEIPQGLGTGNLFINNFTSPLTLKGERLCYYCYERELNSYRSELKNLNWIN